MPCLTRAQTLRGGFMCEWFIQWVLSEDTSKRVRELDKKGGSKQQGVVSGKDPPGSPPDPERALGQEPHSVSCLEQWEGFLLAPCRRVGLGEPGHHGSWALGSPSTANHRCRGWKQKSTEAEGGQPEMGKGLKGTQQSSANICHILLEGELVPYYNEV